MIEIVIEGLNMKAVNSLIWSSAILAKFGIVILGVYALILVGAFLSGIMD